MRINRTLIAAIGLSLVIGGDLPASLAAWQEPPLKVTGCVERDAASRTPAFKLVVVHPESRTKVYVLRAPKEIDVGGAVGKLAAVTGDVVREHAAGREIEILNVKALEVVNNECKGRGGLN
jgi:hypothetical protein